MTDRQALPAVEASEPADAGSPPAMMTSVETAAYLRRSPQTLANWRCRGVGPRWFRLTGDAGPVFYDRADVDAWLAARKNDASAA